MTAATFRSMSTRERQIIDALLAHDFPGRAHVREQLATATARVIDEQGSLEFEVTSRESAPVVKRVATEAWYRDDDGVCVSLLLHVSDGIVRELEIYKDDSSPIIRAPEPSMLDLSSRFDENGRTRA